MAKGKNIVASGDPKGVFRDVIISGTPKPGTILEMTTAAESQGKMTYGLPARASGAKGAIAVYCPDELQGAIGVGASLGAQLGHTPGDAAVSGQVGRIYFPVAGEEMNMIVASVAGTADDVAIGALFGVEQSTGKLKADSSYTSAPFMATEVITDPTADYVACFLYLGNNA